MSSQQRNQQQMTTKGSPWAKDTFHTFPTNELGAWNRDNFDPMSYLSAVGEALPTALDFPMSNHFYETDTDYHVHLDLPGVKRDDLDVTLSNGELTIKAERKHQFEMETTNIRRRERTLGRVQRIVPIPSNCNPEIAEVEFVNGCLEVSLPKIIPGPSYSRTLQIGSGKSADTSSSVGSKGRKG